MKDVFNVLLDETYEHLNQVKSLQKDMLDYSEKFLVWIIGFSIGGITLLINDLDKSKSLFGNITVDWAIGLLGLSVVFGVVYRYVVAFVLYHLTEIMFRVQLKFKNVALPPTELLDVSNTNVQGLVGILKMFGKDYNPILENFDRLPLQDQENLYRMLRDEYKECVETAQADVKDAMDFINKTIKKEYGYSDKKLESVNAVNHGLRFRIYNRIYGWAFTICLLSFISSLVLLIVSYLIIN